MSEDDQGPRDDASVQTPALVPLELSPVEVERERSELAALVEDLVKGSRARATQLAYERSWERFATWCLRRRYSVWAFEAVALYLASRVREKKRPTTIEQDAAAIARKYELKGLPSPRQIRGIREMKSGVRRRPRRPPRQARPLLPEDLERMIASLPETLAGARDRALLLVGFVGAFRRAELVSLDVRDLGWAQDGVTLTLWQSKTDQESVGVQVLIPLADRPELCPVTALQVWLEAADIRSGPMFREVTREGVVGESRLSAGSVARIVKRAAAAAGLDAAAISGHSLRAGFLTAAARAGRRLEDIMRQSRHRSLTTAMGYIRKAGVFEDNAAKGLL